jgi:hypothetical protein
VIPARRSHRGRQRCSVALLYEPFDQDGLPSNYVWPDDDAEFYFKRSAAVSREDAVQCRAPSEPAGQIFDFKRRSRRHDLSAGARPSERDPRIAEAGRESPPKGPSSLRRCGGRAGAPARTSEPIVTCAHLPSRTIEYRNEPQIPQRKSPASASPQTSSGASSRVTRSFTRSIPPIGLYAAPVAARHLEQ